MHILSSTRPWLTLTSDVSEVDGLPVWVEQLNDRVVIVPHSAADGGRLSLDN